MYTITNTCIAFNTKISILVISAFRISVATVLGWFLFAFLVNLTLTKVFHLHCTLMGPQINQKNFPLSVKWRTCIFYGSKLDFWKFVSDNKKYIIEDTENFIEHFLCKITFYIFFVLCTFFVKFTVFEIFVFFCFF